MIDLIKSPEDLRKLSLKELNLLAEEIRGLIIETVNANGGHMASNLGIVELTIALHMSFNTPEDKLVFDVSHQVYTHKLLTGRAERFATLRTIGGIAGFSDTEESPHDVLTIGHAGCSPALALGLAIGESLLNRKGYTVCVIGDGALTSGLAYEGLSNIIARNPRNMMVILNDNGMSISKNVGWLSQWRNRWFPELRNQLELDRDFQEFEKVSERLAPKVPLGPLALNLGKGLKKSIAKAIIPDIGQVWEQMGFEYLGPVNGHNIKELTEVIAKARDNSGKVPFVHVITNKGNGYPAAEMDPVKYHQPSTPSAGPTYSKVFCDTLSELMANDPRIVAIGAAMLEGTGLSALKSQFSDRVIDAGICEQGAVSIAAGMARSGLRPVVCIYSTFLQRAFDQIMHDVCLNDLPVVFGIDRAGICGEDGKTHQGLYDLAYMRIIPNMILSAPRDKNEMRHLLYTAINQDHPFAIRYPRGMGYQRTVKMISPLNPIRIGSNELLNAGSALLPGPYRPLRLSENGRASILRARICLVGVGELAYVAMDAVPAIEQLGIMPTVIGMRFVKPVTDDFIKILRRFTDVIVLEEGTSCGGATAAILEQMSMENSPRVYQISVGDIYLKQGTIPELRSKLNLTVTGIVDKVQTIIGNGGK